MFGDSAVSLLFKLKADSSQGSDEFRRFRGVVDRELRDVEKTVKTTGDSVKSSFSSAFSGGFLGGLASGMVAQFTSALAQIPAQVSQILGEAVKIAEERTNALKGLESVANFKGVDPTAAKGIVENLRLVKAGVVDVSDASTGLKNLLATGFSADKAAVLLERFSDSAAFGKQSALSFGDAIRSATEGIKNQNSVLVDNAGVTKNISAILEEAGFKMEDLGDKTKKTSALAALYNGLLTETQAQVGDADKLTQGYTGSVAGLDTAYKNLLAAGGDILIQNPQILEANKILTEQINNYKDGVNDASSDTSKFANNAVKQYATIKAQSINTFAAVIESIKLGVNTISLAAGVVLATFSGLFETIANGLDAVSNNIRNRFGEIYNDILEKGQSVGLFGGAAKFDISGNDTIGKIQTPITDSIVANLKIYVDEIGKSANAINRLSDASRKINERIENVGRPKPLGNLKEDFATSARDKMFGGKQGKAEQFGVVLNEQGVPQFAALPKVKAGAEAAAAAVSKASKGGAAKKASTTDNRTDKQAYEDFVRELKKLGATFKPGQTFRTFKDQQDLFNRLPKGQAARPGTSDHEFYKAVDLPPGFSQALLNIAANLARVTLDKPNVHQGTGLHNHQGFQKGKPTFGGGENDLAAEQKKLEAIEEKKRQLEEDAAERGEKISDKVLDAKIKALDAEVKLRELANKQILEKNEGFLKAGTLTEENYAILRGALEENLLEKKKEVKERERKLIVTDNEQRLADFNKRAAAELAVAKPEDKAGIQARINDERKLLELELQERLAEIKIDALELDNEISTQLQKNANDEAEARRKSTEEQKKALEELLDLRRDVAEAEAEVLEFRKEQERKSLSNDVESSFGSDKLGALVILRTFDLEENKRRTEQALKFAKDDRDASLRKIEDLEKEKEKVAEINNLYQNRIDLINGEKEAKDKDIVKETTPTRREEKDGESFTGIFAKGIGDLVGGGVDPLNKITEQGEYIKAVYADVSGVASGAIGSMVQGLGQMAAAWIATGKFSGKAALQMASQVLIGIATQAGTKALFELAEGYAAAASFNPVSATAHFTAAAIYGKVAGVAAIGGAALGFASRAFGKDEKSGSKAFNKQTSTKDTESDSRREQREKEERVITEEERNQRNLATAEFNRQQALKNQITIDLNIQTRDSHIVGVVQNNVSNRGALHNLIVRTADG